MNVSRRTTRLAAAVLLGCFLSSFLATTTPSASARVPGATPSLERSSAPSIKVRTADEDSGPRPLLIVLDTSGSMAEDDGTGTIKLAGAQAALTQVLRQQRPDSKVGLWTFPNDGDCGSGTSTIDMGPLNQRVMIPAIRELEASGGTPTGTALRAAVDSIKGQSDGATVLLISDGLHTCDPDPCDVAKEIVADGFDLTVYPAGFQTSAEGFAELQCIADATGGEVYEAADTEQLNEVVTDATNTELTLDVQGMPTRIPAGGARNVKVTVTNNTAQDISNVRLALSFTNSGGTGGTPVIPSALPPRLGLGDLQAGATSSHTWLIGFGRPSTIGTANYRVTTWGSNSQPVSQDGSVSVIKADQTLSDAGGIIGGLKGKRIAILGDSYSSGEGSGSYISGTLAKGGNGCHKSMNTYMAPLFQKKNVELIACSGAVMRYGSQGATTNAVQDEQIKTFADQVDEDPVEAAFMTIGGNDIGFASIIMRCVGGHLRPVNPLIALTPLKNSPLDLALRWDRRCSDDSDWIKGVYGFVDGLDDDLVETYKQVYGVLNSESAVEKRDGRVAPLYVLAYPQAFPESQYNQNCGVEGFVFDGQEIDFANKLVDDLDWKIQDTVEEMHKDGYRIQMIRSTQEAFLPNNTLCPRPGNEKYLVPPVQPAKLVPADTRKELFHPNVKGYRSETNIIIASSSSLDEELPTGVDEWEQGQRKGVLGGLVDTLTGLTDRLVNFEDTIALDLSTGRFSAEGLDVRAGQTAVVKVSAGAPESDVHIGVASRNRMVGSIRLDSKGRGEGTISFPRDLAPGPHHVQALGFDGDGNPVTAAAGVDVAAAAPPWLLPLLVAVLVSLVAGLLLLRRGLRRIRDDRGVSYS